LSSWHLDKKTAIRRIYARCLCTPNDERTKVAAPKCEQINIEAVFSPAYRLSAAFSSGQETFNIYVGVLRARSARPEKIRIPTIIQSALRSTAVALTILMLCMWPTSYCTPFNDRCD
jgi:hypothetical protein